jgi:hypothetical protein
MGKLIFHYSKIEETFNDLLLRASQSKYKEMIKRENHLIMIPFLLEREGESCEDGYHISIFRESWDGQIKVKGVAIGNHSLHVTDELIDKGEDGRSVYYEVVPLLRSISTQNSCSSTLPVPGRLWHPKNHLERILHEVLGVEWRLQKVSTI